MGKVNMTENRRQQRSKPRNRVYGREEKNKAGKKTHDTRKKRKYGREQRPGENRK